jgi:flagellar hook assembly protein FlgD
MATETATFTPTQTPTATPFIIHYKVSSPGRYSLKIYNSAGELVRELLDLKSRFPIEDDIPWDGKNMYGDPVSSGVYVVYFQSQYYVRIAKFLVLN